MDPSYRHDITASLLPYDGLVTYHESMMPPARSTEYFDTLLRTVPWTADEVVMFGKKITTKRKMTWMADDGLPYTYSKTTKHPQPWSREMLALKKIVEDFSGEQFNACLLNLYHDGTEGMGWHSDNERSITANSCIASVSLGSDRDFSFKHKLTGEIISLTLGHGSLLLMKGETQERWRHALIRTKKIVTPRINLTFRLMDKMYKR